MPNPTSSSRRKFLVRATVGVGLLVGTAYCAPIRRKIAERIDGSVQSYDGNTEDPLLWFEITTANRVIFRCPKMEMGQGIFTGLAQIAAEELAVDVTQIDVIPAATDSGPIDKFGTGGSSTTASLWGPLRDLAATMRVMLINEAARQAGVAASTLSAADGVISGGGLSVTYGEVVARAGNWEVPDVPPLKPAKDYRFVGKPVARVDLREKVIGAPIFGMDVSLPGMLYGAIVRPDGLASTFKGADTSAAEGMPGVVRIVTEKDFVGVIATSYVEAENAKRKIVATWKNDRSWDTFDVEAAIRVGKGKAIEIQKEGKAKRMLKDDAPGLITAEYFSPIGAHAQLEPSGAVADVRADGATIHISTQVVDHTRREVAERLGMKEDAIVIQPTYLGGGFGRRLHTPNAMQAAVLSRAVGQPVKCFFTRKEEFQNDTFRPPTHNVLKATLTPDGRIAALSHDISSGDVMYGSPLLPGVLKTLIGADLGAWRGGMIHYHGIPNYRAVSWRVKLPFATSWWRGLGLLANTFAVESFMDELAGHAGKDPVGFRLDHLTDSKEDVRMAKVIAACAERAGYRNDAVDGRAMGFACSTDTGTPCAHVAEVSLQDGRIRVEKVTCVLDPGLVINPDQVRAQCEGSIIMGMSAVLYERMQVKNSSLRPVIYGAYEMALIKDAPREIDVLLLENDDAPGAVGEPPMGPIGAAIANAVYRLTGERIRRMPLEV